MSSTLKLNAQKFIYINTSLGIFTIIFCYCIAVSLHHINTDIPMISDCFVYPPESYISRFGVISFICCGNLLSNLAISNYIASTDKVKNMLIIISFINSISFGIVGSISEIDNLKIHNMFALVGYISYGIYLLVAHLTSTELSQNHYLYSYISLIILKIIYYQSCYTIIKPIIEWSLTFVYSLNMFRFGNIMKNEYILINI